MSEQSNKHIKYKVFRGSGDMPWDRLLTAAAEFANTLAPHHLVNICHSSDAGNGTVVVWYVEAAS